MEKRILFTGGGGAGTESIWRQLSNKYTLYFADCCKEAIPSVIPENHRIEIPYANDELFVKKLHDVCTSKQIDILVPGVDEELIPICDNRNLFQNVLAPPTQFVKMMLDKFDTAKLLNELNLTAPKTMPIEEANQIGFPMIVKPRSGRGSRGVSLISSARDLESYKIVNNLPDNKLMAQEYIEGVEYTVFIAADQNGQLLAIIPVMVEQKRGITIRAKTHYNEYIIEYIKQFHGALTPSGIYNLQCMVTPKNEVYPFEINPRISTTFCLAIASGFDPFMDINQNTNNVFYPKKEIRLQRYWFNAIN